MGGLQADGEPLYFDLYGSFVSSGVPVVSGLSVTVGSSPVSLSFFSAHDEREISELKMMHISLAD